LAQRLAELGYATRWQEDLLLVQIPEGAWRQVIWRTAAELNEQIRQSSGRKRSTLEEVFLTAVEQR